MTLTPVNLEDPTTVGTTYFHSNRFPFKKRFAPQTALRGQSFRIFHIQRNIPIITYNSKFNQCLFVCWWLTEKCCSMRSLLALSASQWRVIAAPPRLFPADQTTVTAPSHLTPASRHRCRFCEGSNPAGSPLTCTEERMEKILWQQSTHSNQSAAGLKPRLDR